MPCILPSYSGAPTNISGLPELSELLYIDLREGIENSTDALAKLYGTLYEAIVNASPITEFHRREMKLLYEILGKLSGEGHDGEYYQDGAEVYESGFEIEFDSYPRLDDRVSRARCLEVIDMLEMMEHLQRAWSEFCGREEDSNTR